MTKLTYKAHRCAKLRTRMMIQGAIAALALGGTMGIAAAPAYAQSADIDIKAQSLSDALMQLSRQTNVDISAPSKLTRGKKAPSVKGAMSAHDALQRLLAGSGLTARTLRANRFVIERLPSANTSTPSGEVTAERTGRNSASSSGEGALSEAEKGISEILVVGSRSTNVDIRRSEDDPQPYVVFSTIDVERSGASNIEDFLKRELTANTIVETNSQSRPLGAKRGTTSSINLRGLGTNETLILVNGRRTAGVSFEGTVQQPDINGIPVSAIERIEVLPSSASAIYGGVAMGGVVNVILKKDYEGGEIRTSYGDTTSGHSRQYNVSGNYGFSLAEGRTQIMLGGQYAKSDPLKFQDRRGLTERGIKTVLINKPDFLYGSSSPFQGATPNIISQPGFALVPDDTPGAICFDVGLCFAQISPNLMLKNGITLNGPTTFVPVGAAPGSDISSSLIANAGRYNFDLAQGVGARGLLSQFGSVQTTKSMFGSIRQTLFDDVHVFAEFSRSANYGRTITNPANISVNVSASNANNPFDQDVTVAFPSAESYQQKTSSVTTTATVGAIVPLGGRWSASTDYTRSKNSFHYNIPQLDLTAFSNAVENGSINPFVDTLRYSQNLSRFFAPGRYDGSLTIDDFGLRASGTVGRLPAGRPTLTLGLGHRREASADAHVDISYPVTTADNLRLVYFAQSQTTDSAYAEVLVPIVAPKNDIPGIQSLELQMAGRGERYTVNVGTPFAYLAPVSRIPSNPAPSNTTIRFSAFSPTMALRYSPVESLTFRASFAKAFLPPTYRQLLPNPQSSCSAPCVPIVDPILGGTYLVNQVNGGNPDLRPQTSRSWNFGAIIQPLRGPLKGLRINLEYYKITQPNYITTPTLEQLVSNPAFSSHVHRDPATGRISVVDVSPVNANLFKTSGWDLKVGYEKHTSIGILSIDGAGTWIEHDRRQYTLGSPLLEYAGYPSDGGEGKFKGNATLGWEHAGWIAAWTANYYSSYKQAGSPGSPSILQGGDDSVFLAQGGRKIPAQMYHDLFVSYTFGRNAAGRAFADRALSKLSIQLGISNLFNSSPPFDAAYYSFTSPFGDLRLRTFRLTLKKGF